jgi:phosphoglycolate phosphatase
MRRNFDLLVFDWDGTLVDSAAHIVRSIQAACRDLDLPVPEETSARYAIGLGLQDALEHVLPDLDASRYAEVAERYRIHFLGSDQGSRLFPQVEEGIARLDDDGILCWPWRPARAVEAWTAHCSRPD